MNTIERLQTPLVLPETSLGSVGSAGSVGSTTGGKAFKDYLLDSIQEVNSVQKSADQAVEKLATGGDVSPAEVLTAVQKADIAFRMMMQIRNKLMSAYEEVKNFRV